MPDLMQAAVAALRNIDSIGSGLPLSTAAWRAEERIGIWFTMTDADFHYMPTEEQRQRHLTNLVYRALRLLDEPIRPLLKLPYRDERGACKFIDPVSREVFLVYVDRVNTRAIPQTRTVDFGVSIRVSRVAILDVIDNLLAPTFNPHQPIVPTTSVDFVFPTSQQLSDIAHNWVPPPTYANPYYNANWSSGSPSTPIDDLRAANEHAMNNTGFHIHPTPSLPQEPEEEVDFSSLKKSLKHSLKGLGEGCRELRESKFDREGGFKASDN